MEAKANALIHESSPYLLQHAYNPVDWMPWGEHALKLAKALDKPILVSIGYSACHWCHVMERECFEDKDLASMMNEYLICIKVDREERPDVDNIYMDALHAMGLQGGWPLNVFLTPDQKPFYGGTYFPPAQWAQILRGVNKAWNEKREDIIQSAEGLTKHLQQSQLKKYGLSKEERPFDPAFYRQLIDELSSRFDRDLGGMQRAPKFPMPCIWQFVWQHSRITGIREGIEQLEITLNEMAQGGIYDQIGGGFARYSVDAEWHVPHFEKMLYDNGQLLSLYAMAWPALPKPMYQQVVLDTVQWLKREMWHPKGGFYAALDADSEGEEGKFYVWSLEEIQQLFDPEDSKRIAAYYDVRRNGNWEGVSILRKLIPDDIFAKKHGMELEKFHAWIKKVHEKLLSKRETRIRPGLDNKRLAGWNGLAMSGLAHAALYMRQAESRQLLKELCAFAQGAFVKEGRLNRTVASAKEAIPGFLEDYASFIQGLIDAHQALQQEELLHLAAKLTDAAMQAFWDMEEGFFFMKAQTGEALIANKKEIFDNVIPAGNSIMARNLFRLGLIMGKHEWREKAKEMMMAIMPLLQKEVQYLANWAYLLGEMSFPIIEVAVVGPNAHEVVQQLAQKGYSHVLYFASQAPENSTLELFQGRKAISDQTTIYVCVDKACQLPVHEAEEAITMIEALQAKHFGS